MTPAITDSEATPLDILKGFRQPEEEAVPFWQRPARTSKHALRIGMVVALIFLQFFFFLDASNNSDLLPGDWSALIYPELFYIALATLGLVMLIADVSRGPLKRIGEIQPGGFGGFFLTFSLFGTVTWLFVAGLIAYSGATGTALTGVERLQDFVFIGLFVAPTEELVFRAVAPRYLWWPISAGVIFGLFHLFAYSSGATPATGSGLVADVVLAMVLGGIFYQIYKRWGYGAAVGTHAAYDLVVAGVISFGIGAPVLHFLGPI